MERYCDEKDKCNAAKAQLRDLPEDLQSFQAGRVYNFNAKPHPRARTGTYAIDPDDTPFRDSSMPIHLRVRSDIKLAAELTKAFDWDKNDGGIGINKLVGRLARLLEKTISERLLDGVLERGRQVPRVRLQSLRRKRESGEGGEGQGRRRPGYESSSQGMCSVPKGQILRYRVSNEALGVPQGSLRQAQ